jgi:hypothetical protein
MSIMDKIFGKAPVTPAPGTQVLPGNIPAGNPNPAHPANPTAPAATVAATEPAGPVSPLDAFKGLWETDPNAKAPVPTPGMFDNVTPEKLQEAARKNDFSKVATPELLAAINAGGEGATAAMVQMMQGMAQKGFGDSAFATTKIVEQALAAQQEKFMAQLPALMKNQNVSENLRNANPIFNHPAAAPMLEVMKAQVIQKHPNATAAEIQAMAQDYLVNFASAATPVTQTAASKAAAAEMDWSSFE